MNDGGVFRIGSRPRTGSRREWLAHCTALALAVGATWPAAASAQEAPRKRAAETILVVGDSLSAEYGLKRGTGWVALLQARLAQRHPGVSVVNASISGDTTAGGRSRLAGLLATHKPSIVILELGGNDALRGLPLDTTRANLAAMTRAAEASGAKVLIVGMQVPPNYGRQYAEQLSALFGVVAKAEGAALVPFLLKGVADGPHADAMFQADRIHPKEAAHPIMLDNVWPVLEPLLR
ncbi:MAG TPA: arylesterase [Burkholderiaceae bacterium]|nr:arylesterase [Burkholderiaceae bacterium]